MQIHNAMSYWRTSKQLKTGEKSDFEKKTQIAFLSIRVVRRAISELSKIVFFSCIKNCLKLPLHKTRPKRNEDTISATQQTEGNSHVLYRHCMCCSVSNAQTNHISSTYQNIILFHSWIGVVVLSLPFLLLALIPRSLLSWPFPLIPSRLPEASINSTNLDPLRFSDP